jgi:hypothetical protein
VTDQAGNPSTPTTATAPDSTAPAPASNVQVSADGTTVTGNAEADANVGIDTNGDGVADVTVVAKPDGTFEAPLSPPLINGETISVVVTDQAGNPSTPTTATAPDYPEAPVINPSNGNVVTGTSEPDMTIELVDGNGDPIGVATADEFGNWVFMPSTPIGNGVEVSAVAKNSLGQASPPSNTITIDGTLPSIPQVEPSNGMVIEGTADVGDTVIIKIGGSVVAEVPTDGSGNWSYTPPTRLAHETEVSVIARNPLSTESAPAVITVDAQGPDAPVVNISTDGTIISGSTEPNSEVTLVINGDTANPITVTADGSGAYSHTLTQALEYGDTVSATATDTLGNVGLPTTVGYFDTNTLTLSVLEASDGWINSIEASDGIQVKVDLRPTMLPDQQILVKLEASGGYEVEVLHTLTAAEIAAGSVTVTLNPKDGSNPFPQGTANVTAEVVGGTATASPDFGIDTIAPPGLVGSALTLVGNVLTISSEPQTKLTVTLLIAGVEVTDTIYTDNNGLASLDLLQGFGTTFRPDQLLNAQLKLQGEDQAANTTSVLSVALSDLLLGIATAGNFDTNVSLTNLGITGTAEPGQQVEVLLQTPLINTSLTTSAAADGTFGINFIDKLLTLGINLTDLLALNNLGFKVNLKDADGNTEASYGIEWGLLTGQVVTVLGTPGNDVVMGRDGAERFDTGTGDDLILNVGTGDIVVAGDGHDAIQITATNFDTINGGTGIDTLILGQGINLNLGGISGNGISNINKIDLSADGANTLTLNNTTIRAITESDNLLRITGDSSDSVTLSNATKAAGTTTEAGVTYDVYNLGVGLTSQVWVETGTVNVST